VKVHRLQQNDISEVNDETFRGHFSLDFQYKQVYGYNEESWCGVVAFGFTMQNACNLHTSKVKFGFLEQ